MTDHSHADLAHKGDPSLKRLQFFSDGVSAIAINLLALLAGLTGFIRLAEGGDPA